MTLRSPKIPGAVVIRTLWQVRNVLFTLRFNYQWPHRPQKQKMSQEQKSALWLDYQYYVKHISTPEWAASWGLVSLFLDLLATDKFANCLDLGSGFTSYAIRYWSKCVGAQCHIASVDDSLSWVGQTRSFLEQKGLGPGELYTEAEFLQTRSNLRADLVLYDYSGFKHRSEFLHHLGHFLHPNTIVIFDDCHSRDYTRDYVATLNTWCVRNGMQVVSLRRWTLDEFGRYAVLGYFHSSGSLWQFLR